jgi:hypothetical protein
MNEMDCPAYFAKAVSYGLKCFMKLITGRTLKKWYCV